jgi:dolichol-phosphate mannosyltransferase
MLIGISVLIGSSIFIIIVLYFWLLKTLNIPSDMSIPSGFATLAIGIFFLGSIELIAIGLMGEYIGRIYDQTKGRPVFIVRERSEPGER